MALSGAHALGRCHADSSGFDGPWTNAPTAWSNLYFQELLEKTWVKVQRMVFARQTPSCAFAGVAGGTEACTTCRHPAVHAHVVARFLLSDTPRSGR